MQPRALTEMAVSDALDLTALDQEMKAPHAPLLYEKSEIDDSWISVPEAALAPLDFVF